MRRGAAYCGGYGGSERGRGCHRQHRRAGGFRCRLLGGGEPDRTQPAQLLAWPFGRTQRSRRALRADVGADPVAELGSAWGELVAGIPPAGGSGIDCVARPRMPGQRRCSALTGARHRCVEGQPRRPPTVAAFRYRHGPPERCQRSVPDFHDLRSQRTVHRFHRRRTAASVAVAEPDPHRDNRPGDGGGADVR